MQTGSRSGMQTMEQSLAALVADGTVTLETAVPRSSRRAELMGLIERGANPLAGELRLARA